MSGTETPEPLPISSILTTADGILQIHAACKNINMISFSERAKPSCMASFHGKGLAA